MLFMVYFQYNKTYSLKPDVYRNSLELLANDCDVLLFESKDLISKLICFFSKSPISHCAMILKDPYYINSSYKGIYVIETSRFVNKDGHYIHVNPLQDVLTREFNNNNNIYWRSLRRDNDIKKCSLEKIYNEIKNSDYDFEIIHWFYVFLKIHFNIKPCSFYDKNHLFCSALLGYYYNKLNIISNETDWNSLYPGSFYSKDKYNKYSNSMKINKCFHLAKERKIIDKPKKRNYLKNLIFRKYTNPVRYYRRTSYYKYKYLR